MLDVSWWFDCLETGSWDEGRAQSEKGGDRKRLRTEWGNGWDSIQIGEQSHQCAKCNNEQSGLRGMIERETKSTET